MVRLLGRKTSSGWTGLYSARITSGAPNSGPRGTPLALEYVGKETPWPVPVERLEDVPGGSSSKSYN